MFRVAHRIYEVRSNDFANLVVIELDRLADVLDTPEPDFLIVTP